MGFLTDGILKYLFGGLAAVLLLTLVEQEVSLRHALSAANRSLNTEIQCRVGSTCATRLQAEADRGTILVQQARSAADSAHAAEKAALNQQAEDAIRRLQDATAASDKAVLGWKQKYQQALQTPECATWAKQTRACAIN